METTTPLPNRPNHDSPTFHRSRGWRASTAPRLTTCAAVERLRGLERSHRTIIGPEPRSACPRPRFRLCFSMTIWRGSRSQRIPKARSTRMPSHGTAVRAVMPICCRGGTCPRRASADPGSGLEAGGDPVSGGSAAPHRRVGTVQHIWPDRAGLVADGLLPPSTQGQSRRPRACGWGEEPPGSVVSRDAFYTSSTLRRGIAWYNR